MHHVITVQVLDCRGDLVKYLLGLSLLKTLLLYYYVEQLSAGTELCGDVNKALLLVHLVHLEYVRMVLRYTQHTISFKMRNSLSNVCSWR